MIVTKTRVFSDLSHDRLTEKLSYDKITGIFVWKVCIPGRVNIGDVAGWLDRKGNRVIEIDGKQFFAHRLAWFYVHKGWPKKQIDHKNRTKDDNSILNLREAEHGQNRANSAKNKNRKYDLPKGVCPSGAKNGKPFIAQITANKKVIYLGSFWTAEEAHSAYISAARKYHGEFANGG